MRILSTCVSTPSNNAQWWRIRNIGRLLTAVGHEVDFVHYCAKSTNVPPADMSDDSQHRYVITNRMRVFLDHLDVLRSKDYDLVYANAHTACFASILTRLRGIPLAFDMHGDFFHELTISARAKNMPPRDFLKLASVRLMDVADTKAADLVACVSEKAFDELRRRGVPEQRLALVRNGVDLEIYRPLIDQSVDDVRSQFQFDDKLVFGYMGGFEKWQGANEFVEAAFKCDDPSIAFLAVGRDGPPFDSSRIHIRPYLTREQVRLLYSACDVLVLPRPNHPAANVAAPTKFAEYAAMGKPILTTRVGEASDLVESWKCGVVVEDNRAETLVRAFRKMAVLPAPMLESMGKNSRCLAEREFDWKRIGAGLDQAIRGLDRH